jgi:hypothetical protein
LESFGNTYKRKRYCSRENEHGGQIRLKRAWHAEGKNGGIVISNVQEENLLKDFTYRF